MKSLKGSAEEKKLLERYTQQLDAQKQSAQTTLDKTIEELSLDVKL
jgi:hypothetical protein